MRAAANMYNSSNEDNLMDPLMLKADDKEIIENRLE